MAIRRAMLVEAMWAAWRSPEIEPWDLSAANAELANARWAVSLIRRLKMDRSSMFSTNARSVYAMKSQMKHD